MNIFSQLRRVRQVFPNAAAAWASFLIGGGKMKIEPMLGGGKMNFEPTSSGLKMKLEPTSDGGKSEIFLTWLWVF